MKPALIVLPGWAYTTEALSPLVDRLKEHFDPMPLDEMDGAGRPVYLLGWSLGGIKALDIASKHIAKVAGLILIGSTARFCAAPDYDAGQPVAAVRSMLRQLRSKPSEVLMNFYKDSALPHSNSLHGAGRYVEPLEMSSVDPLLSDLNYLLHSDLRLQATQLDLPCIILHGEYDAIVPSAAAHWLKQHIRSSILALHQSEGHELPLRDVDWVASQIIRHTPT